MIREHAYLKGENIYIRYETPIKEELNKMRRSIKRIIDEKIVDKERLVIQDHSEYFEIRIHRQDKEIAKKMIELAGYGEKIESDVKVDPELYKYLELKWL